MIRVCAWCNRTMGRKPGPEDEITHGVCDDCYRHFLADRSPESISDFLDRLGVPVFLVDDDVRVTVANPMAADLADRELDTLPGRYGGDLVECARSRLPGGCGKTNHCPACTIRNTVTDTFRTGRSHYRVPASVARVSPSGERTVRYRISTQKAGGGVLLRIDEVDPEEPGEPPPGTRLE